MTETRHYDAIVIGGGPAGVFAASELAAAGRRAVLLEAGKPMRQSLCPKVEVSRSGRLVKGTERYVMQCPRCHCLTGLGGAAFHFDTNLGYPGMLERSKIERQAKGVVATYSTLERALGSFERAESSVRRVFEMLYQHGVPRAAAAAGRAERSTSLADHFVAANLQASQSITIESALLLIESLMDGFVQAGGDVRLLTRAKSVTRGRAARFAVEVEASDGSAETLAADNVVVAVGKLGLAWVRAIIDQFGLDMRPASKVDVGVRLEDERARMAPLSDQCSNPKLAFLNERGESVRTFCVCAGGRIMQYEFEGAVVLDGQHCLTTPTSYTNFGIVTTYQTPAGADGTNFALDLARRVTHVGGDRPVACTVAQLRRSHAGETFAPSAGLKTSLVNMAHADLARCLPSSIVADVLGMVDRLNMVFPSMVSDAAVVAAPVIERIYPQMRLSDTMESSQPGLFFAGDASSKIIGVTYGAATGLVAADAIAKSYLTSVRLAQA